MESIYQITTMKLQQSAFTKYGEKESPNSSLFGRSTYILRCHRWLTDFTCFCCFCIVSIPLQNDLKCRNIFRLNAEVYR